jgi:hypothetical protein
VIFCFIEPSDAIRAIMASIGREARRQVVFDVVQAWVDEIPERELDAHYAKAVADLDDWDFARLVEAHNGMNDERRSASGIPLVPNRDVLVRIFPSLGERRREMLKLAAGLRGEEAFDQGTNEEHMLEMVLPRLSRERLVGLADSCASIWATDRVSSVN